MSDIAIAVNNLCKRYRIGQTRQKHNTLRDALTSWAKAPMQNFRSLQKLSKFDENGEAKDIIWALKNLSFEVKHGEVIGIIGSNGAGKSTLLKILSRITEPTTGYADVYGRVASMLEVGTGFHPELTGRENIYLNGTILGMSKVEVDRKFDEIVDFSGVEKFIDTPVKRCSSGMRVRLAFAVAAHLDPEILLIDEVLSVGDESFQKKCLGKMDDVTKEGRTVLFVSHQMGAVTQLCSQVLWIEQGSLHMSGPTPQVVARYLTDGANLDGQRTWKGGTAKPGVTEFSLLAVRIRNASGEITSVLDARKPFWIEIEYEILEQMSFCRVGLSISSAQGIPIFTAYDADNAEYAGFRDPGRYISRTKIPGYLLNPGRFVLTCSADRTGKPLASIPNVLSFDVEDTGAVGFNIVPERDGVIRPKLEWRRDLLSVSTPAE